MAPQISHSAYRGSLLTVSTRDLHQMGKILRTKRHKLKRMPQRKNWPGRLRRKKLQPPRLKLSEFGLQKKLGSLKKPDWLTKLQLH